MQRLMLRLFEDSEHSQDQDASFDPELHKLLKVCIYNVVVSSTVDSICLQILFSIMNS